MLVLAKDEDFYVRLSLASNPSITKNVIMILLKDNSSPIINALNSNKTVLNYLHLSSN